MLFRTHASSCIALAAFALCPVCGSLLQVMIALAVETLRGQQQELIAARAVIEGHVGIVPLAVDFAAAPHMQFVVLLSRSGGRQTCDGLGPDSCLQAHQAKKLRIALADAFFVAACTLTSPQDAVRKRTIAKRNVIVFLFVLRFIFFLHDIEYQVFIENLTLSINFVISVTIPKPLE